MKAKLFLIFSIFICLATLTSAKDGFADGSPGSSNSPLRVMLVPTDGGTEEGTKADFTPIFNAVSRTTGLKFEIRVGQSYASVVEGMINNLVDIAFVGPTLYLQAAEKGAAEPLAVAVLEGQSVFIMLVFLRNPVWSLQI